MYRVFLDYIRQLAAAEDATDLQNALKIIAERYELPTFAYLLMPGTAKATAKLISTYPPHWTNHYLQNGYERTDPIILRSGKDIRPFDWSADSLETTDEQIRRFFSEAADFGIRYGFTIPLHDEYGFAAITFATDRWNPAFSDTTWENIHLLQFAAILFHAFARRRLGPPFLINGSAGKIRVGHLPHIAHQPALRRISFGERQSEARCPLDLPGDLLPRRIALAAKVGSMCRA